MLVVCKHLGIGVKLQFLALKPKKNFKSLKNIYFFQLSTQKLQLKLQEVGKNINLLSFKSLEYYKYTDNFCLVASSTGPVQCGYNTDAGDFPRNLFTPGYPTSYPNNQRCEWTLRAMRGYQVMLNVYNGNSESCCDYLQVLFGNFNYYTEKKTYQH